MFNFAENRRMKKLYFFLWISILASWSSNLNSQQVEASPEFSLLMEKRLQYNRKFPPQGYRIHVFSQSGNYSRNATNEAQLQLLTAFPLIDSYITYSEPYFKLRAGNFRTRIEALNALDQVKILFPQAYIVKDELDLNALFPAPIPQE